MKRKIEIPNVKWVQDTFYCLDRPYARITRGELILSICYGEKSMQIRATAFPLRGLGTHGTF